MRALMPELPRRGARPHGRGPIPTLVAGLGLMHANRRYVKLAWIGLLTALALPSLAQAEIVAPTRGPALLAVAADGSPRVAFVSGRDLVLARRAAAGWTFTRLGRVPGTGPVLA